MNDTTSNFNGMRILVAEDESLVCWAIESILVSLGCQVVGPATRLEDAITMAGDDAIDGAILDVNLRGVPVFPAAARLLHRNIPVILSTGYDNTAMFPEPFRTLPRLSKPFDRDQMVEIMVRTFRPS